MTSRDNSPRAKKSISLSVMLGALLVPIGAYAASALVQSSGVAEPALLSEPPVAEIAIVESPSISTDLGTACGEAGLAMVAAETAGSMSEIQQAALDALRDVCVGEGMPLPDPVGPQTVAVSKTVPPPTSPAPVSDVVVTPSDNGREDRHGRHGGDDHDHNDDDDDEHGRHGGDDEDDHHRGDHD